MKCNQCGKSVEQSCKRDDCGINVATIKAELRRQDLAMRRATDVKLAESEFQRNYAKVADWSEGKGYQKPSDRDMLAQWAASSPQGKLVIQAIARSL